MHSRFIDAIRLIALSSRSSWLATCLLALTLGGCAVSFHETKLTPQIAAEFLAPVSHQGTGNNPTATITGTVAKAKSGDFTIYVNDSTCSTTGYETKLNNGAFSVLTGPFGSNGKREFYAKLKADGKESDCTSLNLWYVHDASVAATKTAGDTTAPTISGVSISPTSGTTAAYTTATLSGTVSEASTVSLYAESTCTTSLASSTLTAAGSFSLVHTPTADGAYTYYLKAVDSASNSSACTATQMQYTYQASPILNFSQEGYSIREDGQMIGSSVTVSRDVIGIASSVVVSFESVSARTGTHFTAGTTTLNFDVTDTSKTIDATTFTVASDGSNSGEDVFFTVRLKSPTSATIGSTRPWAQVNIVDDDFTSDYLFSSTLYTVNENGTEVTLLVLRRDSTNAASVDVTFTDGTAVSGTDFTGTTQTVNFAAGDLEKSITVPITDNSTADDSKSFYAILSNPSGSTKLRQGSISKVRILDNDASVTCSTTSSPFGGGSGTAGDPYRICTGKQFYQITQGTYATTDLVYRLMADIDLHTDNDLDSSTGGTQNFSSYASVAKLSLFGHERVIANWYQNGASTALFQQVTATTTGAHTFSGINLLFAQGLAGTTANQNSLLIGTTTASDNTGYPVRMKDILVTGYLAPTSGDYSGLVVGTYHASKANGTDEIVEFRRVLSAGKVVVSGGGYPGGQAGSLEVDGSSATTPTITISQLYNTASIVNSYGTISGCGGGVFALLEFRVSSMTGGNAASLSGLHNRAPVTCSGAAHTNGGGIFGQATIRYGNLTLSSASNTAAITHSAGGSAIAGLYGEVRTEGGYVSTGAISISNATNSGAVSGTSASTSVAGVLGQLNLASSNWTGSVLSSSNTAAIGGGTYVGGVMNVYSGVSNVTDLSYTIGSAGQGNTNSGAITAATTHAGGIIGQGYPTGGTSSTNLTLSIQSNSNSGAISTPTYGGGIAGSIATNNHTGRSGHSVTLSNNTNSGAIAVAGLYGGGIAGNLGVPSNAANSVTASSNTNSSTGTVTCTTVNGGRCAGIVGFLAAYNATFGSNSNSGAIACTAGGCSGIAAYLTGSGYTFTSNQNTSTGTISGTSNLGGIVGLSSNVNGTNTYTSNSNAAAITGSSTSIGGIAGNYWIQLNIGTAAHTFTNNTNSGAITGVGNTGGIIGQYSMDAGSASGLNRTLTMSGSQNSGVITGSGVGQYTGGIIGYLVSSGGGGGDTVSITNSTNSQSVSGYGYVAGLIGRVHMSVATNTFSLTNSSNSGNISATYTYCYCGGAVGYISVGDAATLSSLTNSGTITGKHYIGGTVGYVDGSVASGTYSFSNHQNTSAGTLAVTGNQVGGVVARVDLSGANTTFTGIKLSNLASISASGTTGGGVIAYVYTALASNTFTLSKSYNTGQIAASGSGGILTTNVVAGTVSVTDSYNTGNQTSVSSGLAHISANSLAGVSVTRSFSTGTVANSAGSVGASSTSFTNTNVFWRKDATLATPINTGANIAAGGGTSKLESEMIISGTYTGFDFYDATTNPTGIWNAPTGSGSTWYPTLR